MATAFFVYTWPRTGSAWLIDLLASHPSIQAHGELLLRGDASTVPYGTPGWPRYAAARGDRRLRHLASLDRISYLHALYRERSGASATGLKVMVGQADSPMLAYLAARRARAVHLVRRNALHAIVSYHRAKEGGAFHPRRDDPVPTTLVSVDCARLLEQLEWRERVVANARRTLRRYRFPVHDVAYEELLADTKRSLQGVLRFLGVDEHVPLTSALVRVRDESKPLLANASEVRRVLERTRFAWMLEGEGERSQLPLTDASSRSASDTPSSPWARSASLGVPHAG